MPTTLVPTEALGEACCWAYLATTDVGRIAVLDSDGGIDIFPISFVARDRVIYFRTGSGSSLAELTIDPAVSFELDGRTRSRSWSVVVRGKAESFVDDEEISYSGLLSLRPRSQGAEEHYVRLTPRSISGRMLNRD